MTPRRRRLLIAAVALAVVMPVIGVSNAGAAFHLIKVREVHPGAADSSYVVLQMLAAGENFVGGHSLRIYDAGGETLHTFTFNSGYVAPNGSHGNNTILVGDTGVQAAFGVAPDDHAEAEFEIPAAGGAVCWLSGQPPDCLAWGDFTGDGSLPSSTGTPADPLGIPAGRALRRTIAPNCPTFLEEADDTDSSAADFSDAFPDPRPNSEPPSERSCSSTTDGDGTPDEVQGGAPTAVAPAPVRRRLRTRIVRGPGRVTRDRTPTFRFRANRRRVGFLCKLDRRRTRRCRSPHTWRRLRYGCHVFRVSARIGRRIDRTPAVYRFRVVKRRQPGLRQFRRCRRTQ